MIRRMSTTKIPCVSIPFQEHPTWYIRRHYNVWPVLFICIVHHYLAYGPYKTSRTNAGIDFPAILIQIARFRTAFMITSLEYTSLLEESITHHNKTVGVPKEIKELRKIYSRDVNVTKLHTLYKLRIMSLVLTTAGRADFCPYHKLFMRFVPP